jgi:hypothetical protein
MKKMLGILALLLATTLPAPAGEPAREEQQQAERAVQRFLQLNERLSLTPAQAEQVRPLLVGVLVSMQAVRDDYASQSQTGRNRRRMERELRAIRAHANARLKRILSWTQMAELQEMRREWWDEAPSWAALR